MNSRLLRFSLLFWLVGSALCASLSSTASQCNALDDIDSVGVHLLQTSYEVKPMRRDHVNLTFKARLTSADKFWSPSSLTLAAAGISALLVAGLYSLGVFLVSRDAQKDGFELEGDAVEAAKAGANSDKPRLEVFDNAKFFLIFGIVLSHYDSNLTAIFQENHFAHDYHQSSSGVLSYCSSNPSVYQTNYYLWPWLWDVPLAGLCFVSGALSRAPPTWSRVQSLCMSVLLPFITYTVFYAMLVDPWKNDQAFDLGIVLHRLINASPQITWYLQSLISWRLLAWSAHLVADKLTIRMEPCFISMSLVLLITSSFVSLKFWSLDTGIAFLPCFATGMLFPIEQLLEAVPWTPRIGFAGICFASTWTLLGGFLLPCPQDSSHMISMHPLIKVKNLHERLLAEREYPISFLSWCEGLLSTMVFVVVFMLMLVLVCPRQKHWFSEFGKGSLFTYLLHGVVLGIWFKAIRGLQDHDSVVAKWQSSRLVGGVEEFVVCFGCAVLLASRPVQLIASPAVDPQRCLSWFRPGIQKV